MATIISELEQTKLEDFLLENNSSFDLLIVAFSHDSRSRHVLGKVSDRGRQVFAVCSLLEMGEGSKVSQFERHYRAKVLSYENVTSQILDIAEQKKNVVRPSISVFLDVSSMSRTCMGEIFSSLKEATRNVEVKLFIAYCLAKYVAPPEIKFPLIRRVAPVHPEFAGWGAPASLPVDAVVSLGYENGKAIGAVEYLEPRARWVFVPNSPEERFLRQVKKHNDLLIESTPETIIDYDVLKPVDTYYQLLSLVMGLVQESRPILLPFGPKIFFAVSLLVAMRVDKVSVWHVDGDDEVLDSPPVASEHSVVFSCRLVAEENN